MQIVPQEVKGDVKSYLKKGALNVWNHQVVYLAPLLLFVPLIGVMGFIPPLIRHFIIFFTGFYFFFLYMEITLTTTQEKYTVSKFFKTWIIAGYLMAMYIKKKKWMFLFLTSASFFLIVFKIIALSNTVVITESTDILKEMYYSIVKNGSMFIVGDAFFIAYSGRVLLSDMLVAEHLNSLEGDVPDSIYNQALIKNGDVLKQIIKFAMWYILVARFALGFQILILIIMASALTFYSMEVFNIDTGKKKKVEQEEALKKEVEKMIPINN